jgi:DNA-binding CsgD family transcriptional regulator
MTAAAETGHRDARELALLLRRLREAESLSQLWHLACELAAAWCGFSRALLLALEDDRLSPSLLGALADPASDALRRRALASPLWLRPGSAESELIRRAEGGRSAGTGVHSVLQDGLGLAHYALGTVMPERRVLALLVLDRPAPEVTEGDRDVVQLFCHVLAICVERAFLRARMRELELELRHLTTSAQAAMHEALESAVALPVDYGAGPVFANQYPASRPPAALRELLTERERQIAELLVAGRSNREIAGELHLSPETVKGYVARVLRKLGAANRADAVSRYLRHGDPGANDR